MLHYKLIRQTRNGIHQLAEKSHDGQAASHGGHATQLQKVDASESWLTSDDDLALPRLVPVMRVSHHN